VVGYKIGTVIAYYATSGLMAVDLTADLHLKDKIIIKNQDSIINIIKIIKIEHVSVDRGRKGETVVINADFPVAIGDELVRS